MKTRSFLLVLLAACAIAVPAIRADAKPRPIPPPRPVDLAALHLAVQDTIEAFGAEYPDGARYLERIAVLQEKEKAAKDGSPEQLQELHDATVALRREVMLAHPLLAFDKLIFVRRQTFTSSHIYSDHFDGSRRMGGNLCILSPVRPDGKVTEIAPQLSEGLFGRFDLSFDARRVVFAWKADPKTPYRIYEIGIDGTGLRQLTFGGGAYEKASKQCYGHSGYGRGFDDVEPCYLPNGDIMFASTRSQHAVFCFPSTATTLHLMNADGRNIRCVSDSPVNEIGPCLMDDGRVIYTRWEYVDKGFGNVQSLWAMRPDGSHSVHVYKNDTRRPAGLVDGRTIPGSRRIVSVGAPHCGLSVGPVILVDNRADRRTAAAMTNITPDVGYPDMFCPRPWRGFFKEPYPLSEDFFVVSHNPGIEQTGAKDYALYVLNARGNRAELYRDPDSSCFQPMPLRPRPAPVQIASVLPAQTAKGGETATLFMQDVYQGMDGIERGRVKYLRVMEAAGVSWDEAWRSGRQGDGAGLQVSAVSHKGDVHLKKIHGVAAVHADGSACVTVPADKNLFLQALDKDYMELQRMRTFMNLMPGERRGCIGCHELRAKAPRPSRGLPLAMGRPVQALVPQPGDSGPRTVHYARDIQPILDRHCIGCHGARDPEGGLQLTGELTRLWNRSYENLINKRLVSSLNCGYGAAHVKNTPPLAFGSHRSKLVEQIRKAPCKAKLTREEFIRIVTWIDANTPYYGTHQGKKNHRWKDEPDFRPLPVAGLAAGSEGPVLR